jgi:hypothetical protein
MRVRIPARSAVCAMSQDIGMAMNPHRVSRPPSTITTLTGPSGSGLDGTEDEKGCPAARGLCRPAGCQCSPPVRSRRAHHTGGGRNAAQVCEWATAQGSRQKTAARRRLSWVAMFSAAIRTPCLPALATRQRYKEDY